MAWAILGPVSLAGWDLAVVFIAPADDGREDEPIEPPAYLVVF
jgi:hypothetical protein